MTVVANFTAAPRVGDGTLSVTFTDSSTGTIIRRKWILGDGTVIDGNDTVVNHTYTVYGKYTVTLVVEDTTSQDSETKEEYVIVNKIHAPSSMVIAQSWGQTIDEYWRLYIDDERRLVYENKDYVYRSVSPMVNVGEWALVEFHPGPNKMYVGTYDTVRRRVDVYTMPNTAPVDPDTDQLEVLPMTSMKIDELKVWSRDIDLNEYYYQTRGRAGYLDNTI